MIVAVMAGIEDAFTAVRRMFGHATKAAPKGIFPFDKDNPQGLIAGLDDPLTRESVISRMHKLHYGAFYTDTERRMGAGLAERELVNRGKGLGGVIFGRPMKGLSMGKEHFGNNFGKIGLGIAGVIGVGEAFMAPKGHKLSSLVGGISGTLAFGVGDVLGTIAGGPLLGYALGYGAEKIGSGIGERLQEFSEMNHLFRHINMGGEYEDTQLAYTMRQRAAQEMSGSVMNARMWLGKEALLMHQ